MPISPGTTRIWIAWLTNPQAMLPGAVMLYRQTNPKTRTAIIAWLKDQH